MSQRGGQPLSCRRRTPSWSAAPSVQALVTQVRDVLPIVGGALLLELGDRLNLDANDEVGHFNVLQPLFLTM